MGSLNTSKVAWSLTTDPYSAKLVLPYYTHPLYGVSWGGLIAPIFFNIYMFEFDKFVYKLMCYLNTKSNRYSKSYLIRYSTEWVFSINCTKVEINQIKRRLQLFLNIYLKLKTAKIVISHFGKNGLKFLGFQITNTNLTS